MSLHIFIYVGTFYSLKGDTTMFSNDYHLIILSGQSNMARMPLQYFTDAIHGEIGTNHTIIVKHAIGGQLISMWDENLNGQIYRTLIQKVHNAIAENGHEPTSVTFIWAQGAADALYNREAEYLNSFDNLLFQLKRDLSFEDIRLIIARTVDCAPQERYAEIREIQEFIGNTYPNAVWVDVDDLNGPWNTIHLSLAGYKQLAERYADIVLNDIFN